MAIFTQVFTNFVTLDDGNGYRFTLSWALCGMLQATFCMVNRGHGLDCEVLLLTHFIFSEHNLSLGLPVLGME